MVIPPALTAATGNGHAINEKRPRTASSSDSLEDALGNVEQWSDVIVDHEVQPTSSRRSSQIPRSLSTHNEYVDEPFMIEGIHQLLQTSEVDQLQSRANVSLLDEISVALDYLYPPTKPYSNGEKAHTDAEPNSTFKVNGLATYQFDEPTENRSSNGNHVQRLPSDDHEEIRVDLVTSNVDDSSSSSWSECQTQTDTPLSVATSVEIPYTQSDEIEIPCQLELTIHYEDEDRSNVDKGINSTVRAQSSIETSGVEEPLPESDPAVVKVTDGIMTIPSEAESGETDGEKEPAPRSLELDGGITVARQKDHEEFFDAASGQETVEFYEPELDLTTILPLTTDKNEFATDIPTSLLPPTNGAVDEHTPVEETDSLAAVKTPIVETPLEENEPTAVDVIPPEECIDHDAKRSESVVLQSSSDSVTSPIEPLVVEESKVFTLETTRPKFTLRLKPMLAVNRGDRLQLEVHFLAQPEPTVSNHVLHLDA